MSRAVMIAALGVTAFCAAFNGAIARAVPIPLPPPYNPAIEVLPISGQALGVDGRNVVGITSSQVGFLYDGDKFSVIQPPGGFTTAAFDIDGSNIVGYSGSRGFLYDGSAYTMLTAPLGARGTVASGVSGTNIVGWYNDANSVQHGFLFDGTTWTTLDHPLGARGTVARGIDGNNIVGTYITSLGRIRGFLFDGTTWTTLNDPFANGGQTIANGIDGNTVVGYAGLSPSLPFIYDGSTFTHPALGLSGTVLTGISGNTMVGYYRDGPTGLDRPFIYTVPEPASLTLGAMGGLILLAVARRAAIANRTNPAEEHVVCRRPPGGSV